jgi:Protein of unknown function (DUF2905)
MAKVLIAIGLTLLVAGVILQHSPGLLSWFGRLPGDIDITRGDTRIFIPVTSMIIVSVVLSLLLRFLFRR